MTNRAKPARSKADRMATIAELVSLGDRLMKVGSRPRMRSPS
jgi:hypothetical protein